MKRKLLLAAMISAGMAMPAMADTTLYGRANLSVDYLDDGKDYSEVNVSSNSSRLGFKGERDFGVVTGIFQIEGEILFDTGSDNTDISSRDTFAGIKGDWGMLRIGKFDTPFKRARGPANFFGDIVGDMRNLARTTDFGRFDERFKNSIHYRSPSMSGLVLDLQYSPETSDADTSDGNKRSAVSTSLSYSSGPFRAALAFEQQGITATSMDDFTADAIRLAASYRVSSDLTLGGFYQQSERTRDVTTATKGDKADVYGFGGQYRLSPAWFLNAHYFTLKADNLNDKDADLYAVGVEYRVDRNLRFYGVYAATSNDGGSSLTSWSAARSATPSGAAGQTASALSAGMRLDF
ncbi:Outer membrane protein (porin) [Ectothiorhodosinus mongolicus]|uniref:Outer membrane protein (Porin) n=1 Tax=Ectothiorhodosinus mongolicus TaxID=233100 RepID=A0A1R3W050_9GAMM|nr:porin [Ectothiorhodosinus mongolicus]ULX56959.1 porin [Ectothiorhodosinus mongolicus]SIT69182.1 Outer membrane protein (porin) [Ectothiorhodosinus mongolicus]